MAAAYKLIDFARSLDRDRCKIQNTPDLLFLCGGPIASDGAFRSARDFFCRYLEHAQPKLAQRVRLAESIDDWFQKDRSTAFPDLLELENYLAHLAALTILFVESVGAIAELGAFAASSDLGPKTIAVMNEVFSEDRSFIAHGPVRRIRNFNDKHVLVYPWDLDDINSDAAKESLKAIASEIADAIKREDEQRPKQVALRDTPGHTLLLVADLIRIPGVAEAAEISHCLDVLGCSEARQHLSRHFSILQSVGLVARRQRGASLFYQSTSPDRFIRYAFRHDARETDSTRIQILLRDSLGESEISIIRDSLRRTPPHA